MAKWLSFFKRFDTPVSTRSFGLFRILYASYNIGLIIQLFLNWPIYFDSIAPFSTTYFPVKLTLLIWLITNLLLLAGLFTRYAAAVNYGFVVFMTAFFANTGLSSFNDDLLKIGGFMLIFLPAGKSFSVDALINRMFHRNRQQTSYLYYLLTVLVSLGLLYLGSGVTKLFSPMWQQGIGLWIPAVTPSYKWNALSFFVDYRWLMYTLNYVVIVFELLFVVLLFRKKAHPYLAITGIGFHLGIALLFPFPYISFGPILYYSLLIPETFWNRVYRLVQCKKPLNIYYNPVSTKHQHVVHFLSAVDLNTSFLFFENSNQATIRFGDLDGWNGFIAACRQNMILFPLYLLFHFKDLRNVATYASENWLPQSFRETASYNELNSFRRFILFVFIAGLCCVQVLTLGYHTYTTIKADRQKLNAYLKQRIAVQDFSTKPANLSRTFFGINSRGLFLDHAFTGSKTVFALSQLSADGNEHWLPVFDKEGFCGQDNIGYMWHKLTFRYFGNSKTQPDTSGLKKYTWIWAQRHQVPLSDLHIRVYRRTYPCPTIYEKGYLDKMQHLSWDTAGVIHWKDSVFHYENHIPDSAFRR